MIVEKAFSHISYTLDNDKYSKLALKMLSNSMSKNIIKPISIRNNGIRRLVYSVMDLSSLASFNSERDKGLIFSVIYHYKEVIKEIDSQTYLKKEFLELDPDRVFMDLQTRKVKFIIILVLSPGDSDGHINFLEKKFSFIKVLLGNNSYFEDNRLSTLQNKCTYIREHDKDPLGNKKRFYYTGRYLKKVKDEEGNTKKYTYDEADRITSVTNALGNRTTYEYNESGKVTRITNPDGTSKTWEYNIAMQGNR